MPTNYTRLYNSIIKKFLLEMVGFENIGSYSVIDSDIIGFRIRQMTFVLDCETMTVKRQISSDDGRNFCSTSIDCEICNLIERKLKNYVNNEIDKIKSLGGQQ